MLFFVSAFCFCFAFVTLATCLKKLLMLPHVRRSCSLIRFFSSAAEEGKKTALYDLHKQLGVSVLFFRGSFSFLQKNQLQRNKEEVQDMRNRSMIDNEKAFQGSNKRAPSSRAVSTRKQFRFRE